MPQWHSSAHTATSIGIFLTVLRCFYFGIAVILCLYFKFRYLLFIRKKDIFSIKVLEKRNSLSLEGFRHPREDKSMLPK